MEDEDPFWNCLIWIMTPFAWFVYLVLGFTFLVMAIFGMKEDWDGYKERFKKEFHDIFRG